MTFSDWFTCERKRRGLTARDMAADFADELGVNETTVFRWKSGDIFPRWNMVLAIKNATRGEVTPGTWYADLDAKATRCVPSEESVA